MILQLSLCAAAVILQLTSSQSTNDVIERDSDVNSCGRTEQLLSHMISVNHQLQNDIAQLKAAVGLRTVTGKLKDNA